MAISPKNTKLLWSGAAGRCSFQNCLEKLCITDAGKFAPHTIGEMAHIKGERTGSNRFDGTQSDGERNAYPNLILLCPTHHTTIDKKENEEQYTVDILLAMKKEHEDRVNTRLDGEKLDNLNQVAIAIGILLAENHVSWIFYGPLSDLAKKNPHNDEAFSVWRSERLSTIAPNNRNIARILECYKGKFPSEDQVLIAEFLIHARSYERWVNDEISYNTVVRFPVEFSNLIEGHADASA